MKKLFLTLLCCSILLTACGTTTEESTTSINTEPVEEADNRASTPDTSEIEIEEDIEPEEPTDDSADSDSILGYPVQYADVMNGAGTDTIGQRSYIEISKDDLKAMSEEQYGELCTYVESLDYNWFSVICDDGTGLVFTGCSATIVTYGELDETGRADTNIGDIIKSGDSFTYTEAQSSIEEEQPVPETTGDEDIQTADSIQPDPIETASSDTSAANAVTQPADAPQTDSSAGGENGDNFNTYDNSEQQNTTAEYVLNTNTMKIHHPSCSSVPKIAPHNYATSNQSVDELISQGYSTCGRCF